MDIEEDLYGDLPQFTTSDYIVQLETKVESLEEQVKQLETALASCECDKKRIQHNLERDQKNLLSANESLQKNISTLFKTAKREILRKDNTIRELQQQLDDLTFRRNQKSWPNSYVIQSQNEDDAICAKSISEDRHAVSSVTRSNTRNPDNHVRDKNSHEDKSPLSTDQNIKKIDNLDRSAPNCPRDEYRTSRNHSEEYHCRTTERKARREDNVKKYVDHEIRIRVRSRSKDRQRSRRSSTDRNQSRHENHNSFRSSRDDFRRQDGEFKNRKFHEDRRREDYVHSSRLSFEERRKAPDFLSRKSIYDDRRKEPECFSRKSNEERRRDEPHLNRKITDDRRPVPESIIRKTNEDCRKEKFNHHCQNLDSFDDRRQVLDSVSRKSREECRKEESTRPNQNIPNLNLNSIVSHKKEKIVQSIDDRNQKSSQSLQIELKKEKIVHSVDDIKRNHKSPPVQTESLKKPAESSQNSTNSAENTVTLVVPAKQKIPRRKKTRLSDSLSSSTLSTIPSHPPAEKVIHQTGRTFSAQSKTPNKKAKLSPSMSPPTVSSKTVQLPVKESSHQVKSSPELDVHSVKSSHNSPILPSDDSSFPTDNQMKVLEILALYGGYYATPLKLLNGDKNPLANFKLVSPIADTPDHLKNALNDSKIKVSPIPMLNERRVLEGFSSPDVQRTAVNSGTDTTITEHKAFTRKRRVPLVRNLKP